MGEKHTQTNHTRQIIDEAKCQSPTPAESQWTEEGFRQGLESFRSLSFSAQAFHIFHKSKAATEKGSVL